MDNFRISSLISQGRIVQLSDLDPTKSYVQIGVHQEGTRQLSPSSPGAYPSYVIPLSELGGGGNQTDFCTINLIKSVELGPDVVFTHPDNSTVTDFIDTNIAITRGVNQPLYNPLLEGSYQFNISPQGTLWNADGWGTLDDVTTRTYTDLANCLSYNIGNLIVGAQLVMWDTINNKYYKFLFSSWTQVSGGGFSYTRNLITITCDGTIHFSDGSSMDTAPKHFERMIIVDAEFGDDTTAQAYNMFKPFKTLSEAQRAAKDGDLIWLNPSTVPYSTFNNLYEPFGEYKYLNYHISAGAELQSYYAQLIFNRQIIQYVQTSATPFAVGDPVLVGSFNIGTVTEVGPAGMVVRTGYMPITSGATITNGAGATGTFISMTEIDDPFNNLSITGKGKLTFFGNVTLDGAYGGNWNIDVDYVDFRNLIVIGQGSTADINIRANDIRMGATNAFFYIENPQAQLGGYVIVNNRTGSPFNFMEVVSNGLGASATVWNDSTTDTIVLYNIQGTISPGDTLTGTSGTVDVVTFVDNDPVTNEIIIKSNTVTLSNDTVLFIIHPAYVQLNLDINRYSSKGVNKDIWNYGGNPRGRVVSTININQFDCDASAKPYTTSRFEFVGGNKNCETYITGNYTFKGAGLPGQFPTLIADNGGSAFGLISFNGTAHITKGSMFVDLNGYNSVLGSCNVKISGKIYIDNSGVAFPEWLYSGFFISSCKFESNADLIINSPQNVGVWIGNYSGSSNTCQVDLNDCQIVNIDVSGTAPATITKGFGAFGGSTPGWGVLRLKNTKVINAATSIQGANPAEPVQVYSAYTNTPTVNITNVIATTAIVTDVNITSNNF